MRRRLNKVRMHRATAIERILSYVRPVGIGGELPEAGRR